MSQDLDEKERQSFIDTVNKSGERLLNTINDIVEISKIEIGDINLAYEEIDISELMKFHSNFFKLQAFEKGIELKIAKLIEGKQAFIKADKQKLDGILMNLIINAIKFTSKGTIEIGSYIENGRLYFYVSDNGKGIPQDKLEFIFDRFVQVELGKYTWLRRFGNWTFDCKSLHRSFKRKYPDEIGTWQRKYIPFLYSIFTCSGKF